MVGLEHFLLLSAALFAIGMFGVFVKRNAIAILLCVELMLNAVNIALAGSPGTSPPPPRSLQEL